MVENLINIKEQKEKKIHSLSYYPFSCFILTLQRLFEAHRLDFPEGLRPGLLLSHCPCFLSFSLLPSHALCQFLTKEQVAYQN